MDAKQKINRLSIIPYGEGSHDTGANPDFVVTNATRDAKRMRNLMVKLQMQSETYDRKLRARDDLIQRRAEAAQEPDPVLVEDIPPTEVVDPVAAPTAPKKGDSK